MWPWWCARVTLRTPAAETFLSRLSALPAVCLSGSVSLVKRITQESLAESVSLPEASLQIRRSPSASVLSARQLLRESESPRAESNLKRCIVATESQRKRNYVVSHSRKIFSNASRYEALYDGTKLRTVRGLIGFVLVHFIISRVVPSFVFSSSVRPYGRD